MSLGPTAQPIQVSLPQGKTCWWSMVTQAAYQQQLLIKDGNGNVVVNQQGEGTNVAFAGQGSFTVNSANLYTVEIKSSSGNEEVIYSSNANIYNGETKTETFTFASEDSTDNDFNDCFVTLTWFQEAG